MTLWDCRIIQVESGLMRTSDFCIIFSSCFLPCVIKFFLSLICGVITMSLCRYTPILQITAPPFSPLPRILRLIDAQYLSSYAREKEKYKLTGLLLTLMWLHPCMCFLNSCCISKLLCYLLEAHLLVVLSKLHHRCNANER